MTDLRQEQYNGLAILSSISEICISYLMDNDDELWKLLYYEDNNCWNQPNLTRAQKSSLIYAGQPNETDYRVFMDVGADNTWTIQACILRISPTTITPESYVVGNVGIAFEIYAHYKMNHMSNLKTRIDYGSEIIYRVFNGADIPEIGRIYFDKKARSVPIGGVPFKGRANLFYTKALG